MSWWWKPGNQRTNNYDKGKLPKAWPNSQKVLDDLITNSLPNISNETEKSRRKKERSYTNFFVSYISIFNDQQDFTEEFWIQKHFAAENRKANWDHSVSSPSNHANSRKWIIYETILYIKERGDNLSNQVPVRKIKLAHLVWGEKRHRGSHSIHSFLHLINCYCGGSLRTCRSGYGENQVSVVGYL
jgi:hypothetical protein